MHIQQSTEEQPRRTHAYPVKSFHPPCYYSLLIRVLPTAQKKDRSAVQHAFRPSATRQMYFTIVNACMDTSSGIVDHLNLEGAAVQTTLGCTIDRTSLVAHTLVQGYPTTPASVNGWEGEEATKKGIFRRRDTQTMTTLLHLHTRQQLQA